LPINQWGSAMRNSFLRTASKIDHGFAGEG
jgi:hypothetical protein